MTNLNHNLCKATPFSKTVQCPWFQHWARSGPHSAQTGLNFAGNSPLSWPSTPSHRRRCPCHSPRQPRPAGFKTMSNHSLREFFGTSSASFIFQYFTPSLKIQPLPTSREQPERYPRCSHSDKHPQKQPKRAAQRFKYTSNLTWLEFKGLWSPVLQ